jgi:hypothetical protein
MYVRIKQDVPTVVASLLFLVVCGASAYGQSPLTCSNATIRGEYGFNFSGQILAGPTAGPIAGAGMIVFDGKGNLTEVDHVVSNGTPPPVEWRVATGTYTVNADCTGTAEIDFTDGSPPIHLSMVVVRRGLEILNVVDNPGTAISSVSIQRDSPL